MKETGCGIAFEEAIKLEKIGVDGLDISGLGGTSWAAVEHYIARELGKKKLESLGFSFWNWGIPTAVSVVETSSSTKLKVIASGGIRTGMDIAKAIALGADICGIAKPLLLKAFEGKKALQEHIRNIIEEFKIVMFLVGAETIEDLKHVPVIIFGKSYKWLKLRGFDPLNYSCRR
jgi:isopentenyl-diphosphate delta-isomerase